MDLNSDSSKKQVKNVTMRLSHSEFYELALQYNALSDVRTCNVKITRSDFENTSTRSISLSRSDFVSHDVANAPTLQLTEPTPMNRYELRKRKISDDEKITPPAKRARCNSSAYFSSKIESGPKKRFERGIGCNCENADIRSLARTHHIASKNVCKRALFWR